MSDGGDDSGSPWLRDDWSAPPSQAFADEPRVDQRPAVGRGVTATARRAPSVAARIGLVVLVVAAVVAVAAIVLTRDEVTPVDTNEASGSVESDPTDVTGTARPGTDRSTSVPAAVDQVEESTTTAAPATAGAPAESTEPSAGSATSVAPFVVGEVPIWSESSIDIPSPLAEMTVPTEVVVKSDGGLIRRIDIPSGRVRSLDASDLGLDFQLVVGRTAIVAHNARDIVVLRDEIPTVTTPIPEGVSVLGTRPGRDDFVVVIPGDERQFGERELILGIDGSLADAPAAFAELPFWATFFLPTGEIAVNRPGGVYAIGDDGATARVSDGELLAIGAHHFAVERCSSTLDCEVAVVDIVSGATALVGDTIAGVISSDIGTRLSPDGESVIYIGYGDDVPERRIADVASAAWVSVGGVDQLVWGDSWAADSSGVFTEVSGVLRFTDRVTGGITELGREWMAERGGGGVYSVAARPGN